MTPKKAWDSDLDPKQKYVLLALLHLAGDDGQTVSCEKFFIAELTGMSERTVQRQLRRLEKSGWIEVVEESRQHLPRVYKIKNPSKRR